RPIRPHPNYVTARGLATLKQAREDARGRLGELKTQADPLHGKTDIAVVERDLRWFDARISAAQLMDPRNQSADRVGFGAKVAVAVDDDTRHYQIVGEDEADAENGLVSYVSPVAKALMGAQVGDEVLWKRPAGDLVIEVLAINYDA
ncbi:MAG: GreA/GreB family elongation factor, partial [Xanthomonadales bacterium]|nr:GreA/GreB family elongation factor [Xanthomonadales bacterium]